MQKAGDLTVGLIKKMRQAAVIRKYVNHIVDGWIARIQADVLTEQGITPAIARRYQEKATCSHEILAQVTPQYTVKTS